MSTRSLPPSARGRRSYGTLMYGCPSHNNRPTSDELVSRNSISWSRTSAVQANTSIPPSGTAGITNLRYIHQYSLEVFRSSRRSPSRPARRPTTTFASPAESRSTNSSIRCGGSCKSAAMTPRNRPVPKPRPVRMAANAAKIARVSDKQSPERDRPQSLLQESETPIRGSIHHEHALQRTIELGGHDRSALRAGRRSNSRCRTPARSRRAKAANSSEHPSQRTGDVATSSSVIAGKHGSEITRLQAASVFGNCSRSEVRRTGC